MKTSQEYFDPETLARIRPLGLRARTLVEGFVAGMHRSPLRGHSIEFAQHREYTFGDDVRGVDWKVFARSDKYYVKQYEDETSLSCLMLLDQSESMLYQGQHSPLSKLQYAQLIACTLTYLVVSQQDSAGLVTFSDGIDDWLPASSHASQFDDVVRILETGRHNTRTALGETIQQVVARLTRPSLLVLISDLLDDEKQLLDSIRLARFARHDVMVIQVLDDDELSFPFDRLSRFEGLEEFDDIVTDPLLIGGAYRDAMKQFQLALSTGCGNLGVDYYALSSDAMLSVALPKILASRRWQGA